MARAHYNEPVDRQLTRNSPKQSVTPHSHRHIALIGHRARLAISALWLILNLARILSDVHRVRYAAAQLTLWTHTTGGVGLQVRIKIYQQWNDELVSSWMYNRQLSRDKLFIEIQDDRQLCDLAYMPTGKRRIVDL